MIPCAPPTTTVSAPAVEGRRRGYLKTVLKDQAADNGPECRCGRPFRRADMYKQRRPAQHDDALPKFRRDGVGDVVTLPDGEITESPFPFLRLTDVAQAATGEDPVQDRPGHWGAPAVRARQQVPHLMGEGKPPVLPLSEARWIRDQAMKGGEPARVCVLKISHIRQFEGMPVQANSPLPPTPSA
jgi:hypothetical protein